jgi:hypothetical protein
MPKQTKNKIYKGQLITDSRFLPEEQCQTKLESMLLNLREICKNNNIDLTINPPYIINWDAESENSKPSIQWRSTFYIEGCYTENFFYQIINDIQSQKLKKIL